MLSYEKGLKEHPDQPHHAVYYEQLKQVRLHGCHKQFKPALPVKHRFDARRSKTDGTLC